MAELRIRSQQDLAVVAGINKSSIGNLWKARHKRLPFADDAVRIAKALKTTVEYLVTGEGKPFYEQEDPEFLAFCKQLHELTPTELAEARGYLMRYLEERHPGGQRSGSPGREAIG